MSDKIRIGFIGAGGIAPGHYTRLLATRRAEIVALTEPSEAALARFRERCPGSDAIPAFGDYQAMLDAVALDSVVILSPHACHFEQITVCLQRGLHVLTEKPMVCSTSDARALMDTAAASGKVLSLSYQRHYDPVFRYMRDEIQQGHLGEIQFVQAMQAQEWLRLTRGTWRQSLEISGGGQLNDSGSHLIDIVLWVTGLSVAEVYARSENFGTEVDVNTAVTLSFTNGAMGNLSVIGNAPTWHEDHTIIGSKGAFYLRQDGTLLQQNADGEALPVTLPDYQQNPDSNFIGCIRGETNTETPPQCGLESIQVTEAIWRSIAEARPVSIP